MGYKDAVEMEGQRERWVETSGEIGVEEIRGVRMYSSITAFAFKLYVSSFSLQPNQIV